uniref:RNA-directed RNA polymerase catalytic subunit n=1 Tax=Dermapteran orthomyxo-related virus OKIAV170 TaxID=2746276 RepID=A0A7D7F8P6_9ORTO|nr:polymerase PB1 [Dermapteran orthomyxo-related virus OKIAV170]
MYEEPLEEFEEYPNSLIIDCISREDGELRNLRGDEEMSKEFSNNLSLISCLYMYVNTPPHGYGSHTKYVAETVRRSYSYNLKPNNKEINLLGRKIERMHWETEDGDFPLEEIHGNYSPSHLKTMISSFLLKHSSTIDNVVEEVITKNLHANSDLLTRGKQTLCPMSDKSVAASTAYKRVFDFYQENLGLNNLTMFEYMRAMFVAMGEKTLKYNKVTTTEVTKKFYDKLSSQYVTSTKNIRKMIRTQTSCEEESFEVLLGWATKFASYVKHKERGKKDRRAIASANMFLRVYLFFIEEFHLKLSKILPGSTISIGGEEKKAKISSTLNNVGNATIFGEGLQGTEDATKWNECLAPSAFAMMHKYFFDKGLRNKLSLQPPSKNGLLFSKIARVGNFLMSMKTIQMGCGPLGISDRFYNNLEWDDRNLQRYNEFTREWYNQVKDKKEGCYYRASPGMLMGMLNAGSTTLGLLACGYFDNPAQHSVVTLRSSDDSMSLFLGMSKQAAVNSCRFNKAALALIGINLSPDKTFIFGKGFGEYTSWYQDGVFISQFGVETGTLRPGGVNPADDLFAIVKGTSVNLNTLTINHLGAVAKIRIGVSNVRRLWRIKYCPNKRKNISSKVLLVEDGGDCLWSCGNCHLEETTMKEIFASNDEEKDYLQRVRNPSNPFCPLTSEKVTFSRDTMSLQLSETDTPKNVFHFVKRSNRSSINTKRNGKQLDEKCHDEAQRIIKLIDPILEIKRPCVPVPIHKHLSSMIELRSENFDLSYGERRTIEGAIEKLMGLDSNLEEEMEKSVLDDEFNIYPS